MPGRNLESRAEPSHERPSSNTDRPPTAAAKVHWCSLFDRRQCRAKQSRARIGPAVAAARRGRGGASAGAGEQEQPQLLDHARASITGVVVGPMLEMVDPSDDNSVSASRAYESRTLLSRVLSEVFRSLFAFLFYILIYIILLFKFLIHMNRA